MNGNFINLFSELKWSFWASWSKIIILYDHIKIHHKNVTFMKGGRIYYKLCVHVYVLKKKNYIYIYIYIYANPFYVFEMLIGMTFFFNKALLQFCYLIFFLSLNLKNVSLSAHRKILTTQMMFIFFCVNTILNSQVQNPCSNLNI